MRTRRLPILLLAAVVAAGATAPAGAQPGPGHDESSEEVVDDVFEGSSHRAERLPDGRVVTERWEDDGTEDGRWVPDGAVERTSARTATADVDAATGADAAQDRGAAVSPSTARAAAPVVARPTFAG